MLPGTDVIEDGVKSWIRAGVDPKSRALLVRSAPGHFPDSKKTFAALAGPVSGSNDPFYFLPPVGRKIELHKIAVECNQGAASFIRFGTSIQRGVETSRSSPIPANLVPLDSDDSVCDSEIFMNSRGLMGFGSVVEIQRIWINYMLVTTTGVGQLHRDITPSGKPWVAHGGEALILTWFTGFPQTYSVSIIFTEEKE
jgi:hypothetical protein